MHFKRNGLTIIEIVKLIDAGINMIFDNNLGDNQ